MCESQVKEMESYAWVGKKKFNKYQCFNLVTKKKKNILLKN